MCAKNIGIYLSNLIPLPNATHAQIQSHIAIANAIGTADFTTGFVFELHVDALGNLSVFARMGYFHGLFPLISNGQLQPEFAAFPQIIGALRAGGKIKEVFFTIGCADWEKDFTNVGTLIEYFGLGANNPLHANLATLQRVFQATGIDFDLEPAGGYASYQDTVVRFSRMIGSLGMSVSFCAYAAPEFWLGCLERIFTAEGRQIVWGINLQCYSGGSSQTQRGWVDQIRSFPADELGISDPTGFVNPGFGVSVGAPNPAPPANGIFYTPAEIEGCFSNSNSLAAGARSGWLYDSGGIGANFPLAEAPGYANYAQAVIRGLDRLPTP